MKRISEYDNITTVAENDVLPIVDVSDTSQATTGSTRKGTIEKIADYLKDRVETFTGKTLISPKINEDVETTITSTELNYLVGVASGVEGTGWTPAVETWIYASADDPTYTFTIDGDKTDKYSAGMRIKWTQTTVRYGIITAVSESEGTTTVTLYGGTDYDMDNATITDPNYSTHKAPQGFPLDPEKWSINVTDSTNRSASITQGVWTNVGSTNSQISIPIGYWNIRYSVLVQLERTSAGTFLGVKSALSTASNSSALADFIDQESFRLNASNSISSGSTIQSFQGKEAYYSVSSKTTLYLNMTDYSSGGGTGTYLNSTHPMLIRATCAYL